MAPQEDEAWQNDNLFSVIFVISLFFSTRNQLSPLPTRFVRTVSQLAFQRYLRPPARNPPSSLTSMPKFSAYKRTSRHYRPNSRGAARPAQSGTARASRARGAAADGGAEGGSATCRPAALSASRGVARSARAVLGSPW